MPAALYQFIYIVKCKLCSLKVHFSELRTYEYLYVSYISFRAVFFVYNMDGIIGCDDMIVADHIVLLTMILCTYLYTDNKRLKWSGMHHYSVIVIFVMK